MVLEHLQLPGDQVKASRVRCEVERMPDNETTRGAALALIHWLLDLFLMRVKAPSDVCDTDGGQR